MIVNSGYRGAQRIGTPRNMRGFRIHGYGAYFGAAEHEAFHVDTTAEHYETSPETQSTDVGGIIGGIGSAAGSLLTGILSFFTRPVQQGTSGGYGSPAAPSGGGSSIDTSTILMIGAVGVGALLLLRKK